MKRKKRERKIQKIVVSPYIPGENGPIEDIKRGIIMVAFSKVLPMPLKFKTRVNEEPTSDASMILCLIYEELENDGVKLIGGIFSADSDSDNFKNALVTAETIIDPPRC